VQGYKDLKVYQLAFELAMKIFACSKLFPKEETYSLTDQVRRSSRSVCANIGEGYRKRMYPKHFLSKLTDADSECSETRIWLDFALACGYLSASDHQGLYQQYEEVGRMIGYMIRNPEKFGAK
jgi:four helix bundle protein